MVFNEKEPSITSSPTMTVDESKVSRYIRDPETGGYLSKEEWEEKYGKNRLSTFTVQEGVVQNKVAVNAAPDRVLVVDGSAMAREGIRAIQGREDRIILTFASSGPSWEKHRSDPLSRKAAFKKGKR